ncbi:hypothetical protein HDU84_002609 [Entophlyctis sp. JEL0112]|nr:hypothetical protein HDU84_002609 [Entophlyctis sp. JEL0112]
MEIFVSSPRFHCNKLLYYVRDRKLLPRMNPNLTKYAPREAYAQSVFGGVLGNTNEMESRCSSLWARGILFSLLLAAKINVKECERVFYRSACHGDKESFWFATGALRVPYEFNPSFGGFPRNVTTVPIHLTNLRNAHHSSRKQSIAQLPESDYVQAKSLALTTQSDCEILREAMQQEKRELHEKSLLRVKTWTNTILGQRAKRLAFQAEKEHLAETERNRIDEEWHVVQVSERKEQVEKARLMQYMTTPNMRTLNAKMKLSNVLFERELQVEHKRASEALLSKYAYNQKDLIQRDKDAEIKEIVKQEIQHRNRIRLAREQKEQAELRLAKEIQCRKVEKELERKINEQTNEEIKREIEHNQTKWRNEQKEMQKELQKNIADKRTAQDHVKELDSDLNWINQKFLTMQAKVASKRKELEGENKLKKNAILGKVAGLNIQLNADHDEKLNTFRYQMEIAHAGDFERNEAEKESKRKHREEEINKHRLEKIKEAEQYKIAEQMENLQERTRCEKDKEEFEKEIWDDFAAKRKKLQTLKEFHLQQIGEKQKKQEEDRQKLLELEKSFGQALLDDNAKFHKYALAAIEEFSAEGKNVTPIVRGVLRKSLPFPISPYGIHPNTYQRLGFTVRRVPAECAALDPWQNRKSNGVGKLRRV